MSTHIGQFTVFSSLSAEQHQVITTGWINEVNYNYVANELRLPMELVRAYYAIKDISYYEVNKEWPSAISNRYKPVRIVLDSATGIDSPHDSDNERN